MVVETVLDAVDDWVEVAVEVSDVVAVLLIVEVTVVDGDVFSHLIKPSLSRSRIASFR